MTTSVLSSTFLGIGYSVKCVHGRLPNDRDRYTFDLRLQSGELRCSHFFDTANDAQQHAIESIRAFAHTASSTSSPFVELTALIVDQLVALTVRKAIEVKTMSRSLDRVSGQLMLNLSFKVNDHSLVMPDGEDTSDQQQFIFEWPVTTQEHN